MEFGDHTPRTCAHNRAIIEGVMRRTERIQHSAAIRFGRVPDDIQQRIWTIQQRAWMGNQTRWLRAWHPGYGLCRDAAR